MKAEQPGSQIGGFFKHSTVYAMGNVLNRVGSFLLLPLYTHHLSVADYGALELFYVTASVISSILSVGLAHATLRFYYEYAELSERNRVVSTCLITTVAYSVPFVLLLSTMNTPMAKLVFNDASYASTFNVVYAILILELMRQIGLAYFRAREYSTLYVAVCFVQLVLQVACNVYTVGFRKWGVPGVLWGNLLSVFGGWLFVIGLTVKECGWGYDAQKMKVIFKYSYPFLFTAVIGVILGNMDRIIIRAFFSLTEVGLYALAFKFGNLIQELLLEPFNRSLGAYRFKIMKDANVKEVLIKIFDYLVVGVFLAGLGVSLFSPEVLRVLSDPAYWRAASVIPLLVLSFAVSGVGYTLQTGFLYVKKTKYMIHITLITSIVNVLLYLILIPRFGIYGAAAAVAGKSFLEVFLTYWISHRYYPVSYELFKSFKVLGAAALLASVSLWVPVKALWLSIVFKTALMAAFPALLYFLGCVHREEWEQLKALLVLGARRLRFGSAQA